MVAVQLHLHFRRGPATSVQFCSRYNYIIMHVPILSLYCSHFVRIWQTVYMNIFALSIIYSHFYIFVKGSKLLIINGTGKYCRVKQYSMHTANFLNNCIRLPLKMVQSLYMQSEKRLYVIKLSPTAILMTFVNFSLQLSF